MFGWNWSDIGLAILDPLLNVIGQEGAKELAYQAAKRAAESTGQKVAENTANHTLKIATEKAVEAWRSIKWSSAEAKYRQHLTDYVSTTRLLGNPKPVQIDHLYTDLFVYQQISAFRRSDLRIENPSKDPYTLEEPYARFDALELVLMDRPLYILGHPGAGKTTFLKYLAIIACRNEIERVPLYIPLRDVVRLNVGIKDYMAREFDICEFPDSNSFVDQLLSKRKTLLLVDGLDEVEEQTGKREPIIQEIREIARRYTSAQLVVTCRIASSSYAFEQFTYAEVANFTENQQRTFIAKWFGDDHTRRDRILSAWGERRVATLRDLAKTPLLLALICLAFDELGDVPERHVDLYRDSLDALVKRWDSSRNIHRDPFYAMLRPYRREQLLQELASELHHKNKILFRPEEISGVINGWFEKLPDHAKMAEGDTADLLDQMEAQHGLIVQRARGIYSFSHLSLQEYFAARSIAEGHPFNTVERITSQYFMEPRWREVFVFLAGLLPDGSKLLDCIRTSISQLLLRDDALRMLVRGVDADLYQAEAAQERRQAGAPAEKIALYSGNDPALRMMETLMRRAHSLDWLKSNDRLFLKLELAERRLILERQRRGTVADLESAEGKESILKYMQAALLLLDCASIAVCANRQQAVGWLFSPALS